MSVRIEVFAAAEWPEAVASRLADRIELQPDLRLCLPTGATPRPVYAALARRAPDLSRVEVFLLDEFGGLEPGHPARCDEMIQRSLIDLLPAEPGALHTLDFDRGDIETVAAAYEALIDEGGGLDLTLLGLGGNGHLALNEPGSAADSRTRRVCLDPTTIAAAADYGPGTTGPEWGVTLGMANILASREIWLLVSGHRKSGIMRRALQGPIGPEAPASFLREHSNVTVMADDAAASLD